MGAADDVVEQLEGDLLEGPGLLEQLPKQGVRLLARQEVVDDAAGGVLLDVNGVVQVQGGALLGEQPGLFLG